MEYCSGGDLTNYIKKRGRVEGLQYAPHEGAKLQYYEHPRTGGLDEVVVRCFLRQLGKSRSTEYWVPSFIFFQPEHSSSCDRRISYIEISSLRYDRDRLPCSHPMTNLLVTHRIYSSILWAKMNSGVATQ